jgi:16S rRNA (cytosine1402-N4)-methyltransferase
MDVPPAGHDPVLLRETIGTLLPSAGKIFVDCTTGRGGHALSVARHLGAAGLLLCLDADPRNLEFARTRLEGAVPCRVRFFHANFAELPDVLHAAKVEAADGILADLGLSTNQLFDEQYGLSFAAPMPLDMRIDPRTPRTAAHLVNQMREEDLANVLYELAQERYSRRIARKIVDARRVAPITTTDRLADLVRSAIPRGSSADRDRRIDPATRTFMALRMAVNRELENLQALLERAPRHLTPGGRLGVISFHSGEDRIVKQSFRSAEQTGQITLVTRKPVTPADDELAANPRARSAKLRVAERNRT